MSCLGYPDGKLYVILPYFNYCNFIKRKTLFIEFLDRIKKENVNVVVISTGGLPQNLCVYRHIEVDIKSRLWIKENLINMAVARLPKSAQYIAWVDADITFLNKNWVKETVKALRTNDVVQLFQTAVNLGPNGEALKIDKSFAYMHTQSGTEWTPTDRYGHWHPGYGWACTRKAFKQMGGLIDWAILGSGDRHLAMAFIGKAVESAPGTIHEQYRDMLRGVQSRCRLFTVGCVNGTILHHWHGKLENRKYKERWNILVRSQYNPMQDIAYTKSGLIYFTQTGRRLQPELDKYFSDRNEDDDSA